MYASLVYGHFLTSVCQSFRSLLVPRIMILKYKSIELIAVFSGEMASKERKKKEKKDTVWIKYYRQFAFHDEVIFNEKIFPSKKRKKSSQRKQREGKRNSFLSSNLYFDIVASLKPRPFTLWFYVARSFRSNYYANECTFIPPQCVRRMGGWLAGLRKFARKTAGKGCGCNSFFFPPPPGRQL